MKKSTFFMSIALFFTLMLPFVFSAANFGENDIVKKAYNRIEWSVALDSAEIKSDLIFPTKGLELENEMGATTVNEITAMRNNLERFFSEIEQSIAYEAPEGESLESNVSE